MTWTAAAGAIQPDGNNEPTGSSPTSINSYEVSPKIDLYDASFLSPSHSVGFGCTIERWQAAQSNPDPGPHKVSTNATFCGVSGFLHGDHFSQASRLDRDSY
ncbi:hypothetical protein ASPCAL12225 [Aspergillus calidoustus]|uniref:Uncharacterized protein n=1 Tax=Aspergillus calidoustus TaxID=454130 RepID=A0A0U5GBN5_ASPCI|nr:hypothetical protein ASPCAL12225 [Aspergillus calidoustus]